VKALLDTSSFLSFGVKRSVRGCRGTQQGAVSRRVPIAVVKGTVMLYRVAEGAKRGLSFGAEQSARLAGHREQGGEGSQGHKTVL